LNGKQLQHWSKEATLTQTGITNNSIDIMLTSSDIVLLCTITEFKDYKVMVIPVMMDDKGSMITTIKTIDEPINFDRSKRGGKCSL